MKEPAKSQPAGTEGPRAPGRPQLLEDGSAAAWTVGRGTGDNVLVPAVSFSAVTA